MLLRMGASLNERHLFVYMYFICTYNVTSGIFLVQLNDKPSNLSAMKQVEVPDFDGGGELAVPTDEDLEGPDTLHHRSRS